MPPSLREWLPEEHLAWFVLDAVGELELGAFHASYRDDGWGRAAHDPAMMVALFVYAYAIGVRSSRAIERRCWDDVAFRVITANQAPDHATIARFRVRHEAAIGELFSEVLALCARSGLVKVGVVAVDGTKIAAAATHHATRSYEQIAQEILEDAARIDAAEDELLATRAAMSCRRGCERAGIAAKCCARPSRRWTPSAPREAKKIPRGRSERLVECRRRLRQDWELERHVVTEHAAWHAAGIASDGSRRMVGARHNIKPYPLTSEPAGKINVSDPDSRNLKTTRGWVQGYNAQAVVGEGQIVLAAEISTESLDTANLAPMIQSAVRRARGGRRHRSAGRGVGRRRLLEERRDRGALRRGDSDARRARRRPPQTARPGRRGGPYDFARQRPGDRLGQRALPQATRQRSSRSSARSRATAAPTASSAAADQRSDRNGGC